MKSNNPIGLPAGGATYNTLEEAVSNLPDGYKLARYGYETYVIVSNDKDFVANRYGEIGYLYTGSAA